MSTQKALRELVALGFEVDDDALEEDDKARLADYEAECERELEEFINGEADAASETTDTAAKPKKRRRPQPAEPSELPHIDVRAGELHIITTAAEAAIIKAGIPIYQRGRDLVLPATQIVPASNGRTTVTSVLSEMTAHSLVDVFCQTAVWQRFDARSNAVVRTNPPKQIADILLSRFGQWQVPHVAGVVTALTMRPDGSILSAPGYDAVTRLYHSANADLVLSEVVKNPTQEIAMEQLQFLKDLLSEFPFVNEVSEAVALSGLITPVVRGAMSVVPMHAFRAPTAGSGKSFLVDIASAIASGNICPVAAAGENDAETEKRLAGLLLAGFPIASLDNVNGELGGDLLCQAIERPFIRLRRLGGSEITEIENKACMYATGNGLRVRGDMVRRTLIGDLDANMERPELRVFIGDPVKTVFAERGKYVSACLTIVRAYILAGRPNKRAALASFEDWSDSVRSALVWLGCADPACSMERAREDDPELAELREVLTLWAQHFGIGEGLTVRDIIERVDRKKPTQMGEPTDLEMLDLRDALIRIAGERGFVNANRLGTWLMNREERIVNGLKVARSTMKARNGAARWQVNHAK